MDAYSMSVTSAARKKTSKIYQDLKTTRLYCASPRRLSIMDKVLKVFNTQRESSPSMQSGFTSTIQVGNTPVVHKWMIRRGANLSRVMRCSVH
jgi:hypothetical protein